MKRILLTGLVITASFSLVAMTHAQQRTKANFSSYGYSYQDVTPQTPVPATSPSDAQVPDPPQPAINDPSLLTPSGYNNSPVTNDLAVGENQGVTNACDGFAMGDCGGCALTTGCGGRGKCHTRHIGSLLHSRDRNIVVGVRALIFDRDYEDDIGLGYNANGDWLFTTDSRHDWLGGLEATISNRSCTARQ
ncbi:MAG: hypothetical protein GY904_18085 [Planctomycetaceae bacterium]|nr:hypothetical protein [Planctomycetaceae bacterium]